MGVSAHRRIGLTHTRSHALRHAFACRLVENGSSLKEVADLLRHRSLNTTLIYAKLDTPKLVAVARERIMSARIGLQQRINDYLAERHRLGFELRSRDTLLAGFARYVAARHHHGPLTADLMIEWARHDKWHHETPATWAARLARVRHFARYLKQFEPETEVPDESVFGPEAGRVAPHIFHDEEIVQLLAAARQIGPPGSIRPTTPIKEFFTIQKQTALGRLMGRYARPPGRRFSRLQMSLIAILTKHVTPTPA